ncbi:MAG: ABC transporter ATP-binding protein [Verrucomicrobiia bacterium]
MIELIHLTKKFGDFTAVDDISVTIPKGEFFAVLGPNAAGKTTTIKMMTGMLKPTAGTAKIAGFDIQLQPIEARKKMAYVPDFPFLYDKLTVWEFIKFTGQIFNMDESDIIKHGAELIELFTLQEFINNPIESLSHGTRQRVVLVSALLHNPEVFIIDEPMVGLDPHHARTLKDILKERSKNGMTVFFSTHQVEIAEELADRIGIINNGRLIAVGTADQLRQQSRVEGSLESVFIALTNNNFNHSYKISTSQSLDRN